MAREFTKFNKDVGERVRCAREGAKLSQTQLGKKIGFSKQWVSAKERGENSMSLKDAIQVSEACNVPLSYFDVDTE